MPAFKTLEKPNSLIGVGLRHLHYDDALDADNPCNQDIDFVEIHAENFFAEGGIKRKLLGDICDSYKLSIHGTSLGLGSLLPLPEDILEKFSQLIQITNPTFVSEHLCFNRAEVNGKIIHTGDLLPLAFNKVTLDRLCVNVDAVQTKIKRPILLENLSAYLDVNTLLDKGSAVTKDELSELEFIHLLCEKTGCGLLVDINNMIVNEVNKHHNSACSTNFNQENTCNIILKTLRQIDPKYVGEIHLAGFSDQQVEGFVVDDHAQPVSQLCWQIYQQALTHFGRVSTLVEWDNNLPSWQVLTAEASKAKAIMDSNMASRHACGV